MKKRNYMPPTVAALKLNAEKGFAVSMQPGIEGWDNETF